MLCGSLDGRGVWAGMDTGLRTAESFCCPPETITPLLMVVGRYKIKSLKKRKKPLVFHDRVRGAPRQLTPVVLPETSPLLPHSLRRSGV